MKTTTRLAAGAVAALTALAAAACGSSSGSSSSQPTAKLAPIDAARSGFSALEDAKALTTTFKIDASSASFTALNKADHPDDPAPAGLYDLLTGGSIVATETTTDASFKAAQAKGTAGDADIALSFDVNAGGHPDLVQLAYLAKKLYARADVKTIEGFGQYATPPEDLASQVNAFLATPTAKALPFLADGANGQWLSIDLTQVLSFVKSYDPSAVPSTSPGQTSALVAAISGVFTKDVTATRAAADPSKGDHLVLTANARTLATDSVAALKSFATSVSPQAADEFDSFDPTTVPDKTFTIDEYVNKGAVDEVDLSVRQFLNAKDLAALGSNDIKVVLQFATTGSVSAPSSSTTIDIPSLIGKLGALGNSGSL